MNDEPPTPALPEPRAQTLPNSMLRSKPHEFDDHDEDAYPFCQQCGRVLEEGWGAVGSCFCTKVHRQQQQQQQLQLIINNLITPPPQSESSTHFQTFKQALSFDNDEADAHPFCAYCGLVLDEKWGTVGECSCIWHEDEDDEWSFISLPTTLLSEDGSYTGVMFEGGLDLKEEDDAYPFCSRCGLVL